MKLGKSLAYHFVSMTLAAFLISAIAIAKDEGRSFFEELSWAYRGSEKISLEELSKTPLLAGECAWKFSDNIPLDGYKTPYAELPARLTLFPDLGKTGERRTFATLDHGFVEACGFNILPRSAWSDEFEKIHECSLRGDIEELNRHLEKYDHVAKKLEASLQTEEVKTLPEDPEKIWYFNYESQRRDRIAFENAVDAIPFHQRNLEYRSDQSIDATCFSAPFEATQFYSRVCMRGRKKGKGHEIFAEISRTKKRELKMMCRFFSIRQ